MSPKQKNSWGIQIPSSHKQTLLTVIDISQLQRKETSNDNIEFLKNTFFNTDKIDYFVKTLFHYYMQTPILPWTMKSGIIRWQTTAIKALFLHRWNVAVLHTEVEISDQLCGGPIKTDRHWFQ